MIRDCGDILDRWSISRLKFERIGTDENKKEYKAFNEALEKIKITYKELPWTKICEQMYSINDFIWQLEAGLKGGKEELRNPHYILDRENEKTLAKIGTTTILIRNFNHLRVGFKNFINTLTKTGFQDIKKNHISETTDYNMEI